MPSAHLHRSIKQQGRYYSNLTTGTQFFGLPLVDSVDVITYPNSIVTPGDILHDQAANKRYIVSGVSDDPLSHTRTVVTLGSWLDVTISRLSTTKDNYGRTAPELVEIEAATPVHRSSAYPVTMLQLPSWSDVRQGDRLIIVQSGDVYQVRQLMPSLERGLQLVAVKRQLPDTAP